MKFYGRTQEQKKLQSMFDLNQQNVTLIYGRRRVGKSELIKETLKNTDTKSIYYECKQTSEQNNANSIAELISETYGYPKLSMDRIEEVLNFIFKKAEQESCVLVLDEYPYVREAVKGMDSILQSLIDQYKDRSKLKLVICGSFVDTMKSLLEQQNPLYGRVDCTIDLQPMDYYDSALFYQDFSDEDKVRIYSVFGGVPYYNRLIDSGKSMRENIIDLIASSGARLENEVSMNLRAELAKLVNANEVFDALSRGFSKYSDILSQSHVTSSPALSDTLDKLVNMRVIIKRSPINDEKNRRKSGYYISDCLSNFYYRYIFRYQSQLNVLDPEVFYDRYIAQDFETKYVPKAFEDICKQYLIRQNRSGNLPELFDRIGSYYYDDPINKTNGEFDIVTQDPTGYIFYEVKFRKEPVTKAMIAEECQQVKATGLDCYKYGFISKSGFEKDCADDNLILINLNEIYR